MRVPKGALGQKAEDLIAAAAFPRGRVLPIFARLVRLSPPFTGAGGTVRFDLPRGNLFQIACRKLPYINGKRDLSPAGLGAKIGIDSLPLPADCDTCNPPLPPDMQR